MAEGKRSLEMDIVYMSDDNNEFRNLHVSAVILDETIKLVLESDIDMTYTEIDSALHIIEADLLRKLRFKLLDECSVVLKRGEQAYTVLLADETPRVKGLSLHD